MKRRCISRHWIGLACMLLIPGLGSAETCLNIRPTFTYAPVVSAGRQSTLGISAQAGCFWEGLSQPKWIKIVSANRGYGSGSAEFQVLPNLMGGPAAGFLRVGGRDLSCLRATW